MRPVKEVDVQIMSALRKDARQTLTNISKLTKIPVSTVYDRINAHEGGVIKKHTSILDFPHLGYNIRTNIQVSVKDKERFLNFISNHRNVNSLFRTEGEYDFMIDCIFKQMTEMQSLMEGLEEAGVEKKQAHFITEELIRENFMNYEANKNDR